MTLVHRAGLRKWCVPIDVVIGNRGHITGSRCHSEAACAVRKSAYAPPRLTRVQFKELNVAVEWSPVKTGGTRGGLWFGIIRVAANEGCAPAESDHSQHLVCEIGASEGPRTVGA